MPAQVFTTLSSASQVSVKPNKYSMSFQFSKTEHKDKVSDLLHDFAKQASSVLESVKVMPGSLRLMPSSSKMSRYNQGYNRDMREVSYSVSFDSQDMDSVSDLLDKLNTLEDVDDPNVSFTSTEFDKHEQALLESSFTEVQRRLETEAKVVGVDHTQLKVVNWNVRADRRQNQQASIPRMAMASMEIAYSGGKSRPPVKVESGEIAVTLTLSVSYGKE